LGVVAWQNTKFEVAHHLVLRLRELCVLLECFSSLLVLPFCFLLQFLRRVDYSFWRKFLQMLPVSHLFILLDLLSFFGSQGWRLDFLRRLGFLLSSLIYCSLRRNNHSVLRLNNKIMGQIACLHRLRSWLQSSLRLHRSGCQDRLRCGSKIFRDQSLQHVCLDCWPETLLLTRRFLCRLWPLFGRADGKLDRFLSLGRTQSF
jgi:hypothetical protein